MVTVIAYLSVKVQKVQAFENTFKQAQQILVNASGYENHQIQKSKEENKYAVSTQWQKREDYVSGFLKSEAFKEWKALLNHFYEPLPKVEYYAEI